MGKSAVILAAGLGSRLKNIGTEIPKGFIKIDNQTLIQRSINTLKKYGVSKIIIGTGHLSHYYEDLSRNQTIHCIKNKYFSSTGSFYTLYNLKKYINDDFLLLESDILYEKNVISILMKHLKDDVIIASDKTDSGDEVFIEVINDNSLSKLSKNKNELSNIYGELVGVSKISLKTFHLVCKWAEKNIDSAKNIHYEEALVKICQKRKIFVEKINNLIWTEIDTEEHYKRALEHIFPKLIKKENV